MSETHNQVVGGNSYLTLHYRITTQDGEEFLSTFDMSPATLQMGSGQLAENLENVLIGLPAHETFVFELEPAQAFGTLLQRSLLGEKRLAPRAPKPVKAPSYVSPARWRPVRVRSRQPSLPSLNVSRSSLWTLLLSPLRALLGQRL